MAAASNTLFLTALALCNHRDMLGSGKEVQSSRGRWGYLYMCQDQQTLPDGNTAISSLLNMKQSDYQTEWLYHKATEKVCGGAGNLNKQQVYFLDISFWLQKMSKKKCTMIIRLFFFSNLLSASKQTIRPLHRTSIRKWYIPVLLGWVKYVLK